MRIYVILIIVLVVGFGSMSGQVKPHTPKVGSEERAALMDALREPVEKILQQKVIFKISRLTVLAEWAFMWGKPWNEFQKSINYKATSYQEAINAGAFDDGIVALFKKEKDHWMVAIDVIGATDVVYEGWDKEYGAPTVIFR
jgi:hypothetical protein